MGFRRYLSGDATHLGERDRQAEDKKGKELSSNLSFKTACSDFLSLPWNNKIFYKTYNQGSKQESMAIRNARAINKENITMSTSRQSFILQRACCEEVMKKLEVFIGANNNILKSFDQNIESLKNAELMSDFFPRLDQIRGLYEDNIRDLNTEAQAHISALAKQVIYLNDAIAQWTESQAN